MKSIVGVLCFIATIPRIFGTNFYSLHVDSAHYLKQDDQDSESKISETTFPLVQEYNATYLLGNFSVEGSFPNNVALSNISRTNLTVTEIPVSDVRKNSGQRYNAMNYKIESAVPPVNNFDFWENNFPMYQVSSNKRRKRQIDYNWRMPKTPPFITKSRTENQEPELRVYPLIDSHRIGRTKDDFAPQRGAKRIIYYASLPDVTRYPTNARNDRVLYQQIHPSIYQQRNYDVSNLNENDYITRVHSPVIDVRQKLTDRDRYPLTRPYTVLEQDHDYRYNNQGYKVGYSYPNNVEKHQYQSSFNNLDRNHLIHNQYKSNPYHSHKGQQYHVGPYSTVDKSHYQVSGYYKSSPYPTRHTRFPSPASLSSYLDLNLFHSTVSPLSDHNHSPIDYTNIQTNLDSSSPDFNSFSSPVSFGSGSDSDFNDLSTVSPLKQKYFGYNNFLSTQSPSGQKYLDFNTFQTDDFSRDKFIDYNKFDPFKATVSDWIANKPFDLPPFDLDDINSNQHDYHLNGLHSVSIDSQLYHNATSNSTSSNGNNTLITPYGISNSSGYIESRMRKM